MASRHGRRLRTLEVADTDLSPIIAIAPYTPEEAIRVAEARRQGRRVIDIHLTEDDRQL